MILSLALTQELDMVLLDSLKIIVSNKNNIAIGQIGHFYQLPHSLYQDFQ